MKKIFIKKITTPQQRWTQLKTNIKKKKLYDKI